MNKPKQQPFNHGHREFTVTVDTNGAVSSAPDGSPGTRLPGKSTVLGVALLLGLIALSFAAYRAFSHPSDPTPPVEPAFGQVAQAAGQSSPPADKPESSILQVFGLEQQAAGEEDREGQLLHAARVTLRLLLAALLASMLAFRPHKYVPALRRNPYVAQTQILLAVVASALMMIVADNAARAFGIFAAASLVRFRTNIRDPKEITVLLINLAIGLATGVGRWELAVILSLFVLATLWILEYFESRQIVRSMQLKVRSHNVAETDEVLRRVFEEHNLTYEVREVDREDDQDPIGRLVYHVTVGSRMSTDQLSEEIFSADPINIDRLEWHQKKSASYAYR